MDATYRSDLRELNELNFARFDAKLERRIAELRGEMDRRFAAVDARFDSLEARLIGRFEARLGDVRSELQRRMIAGWSSLILVMLGTLFAVLRAG